MWEYNHYQGSYTVGGNNELVHWKYIDRKKVNGVWRYIYKQGQTFGQQVNKTAHNAYNESSRMAKKVGRKINRETKLIRNDVMKGVNAYSQYRKDIKTADAYAAQARKLPSGMGKDELNKRASAYRGSSQKHLYDYKNSIVGKTQKAVTGAANTAVKGVRDTAKGVKDYADYKSQMNKSKQSKSEYEKNANKQKAQSSLDSYKKSPIGKVTEGAKSTVDGAMAYAEYKKHDSKKKLAEKDLDKYNTQHDPNYDNILTKDYRKTVEVGRALGQQKISRERKAANDAYDRYRNSTAYDVSKAANKTGKTVSKVANEASKKAKKKFNKRLKQAEKWANKNLR